jgi:glycosyltransferase involved in cell wall biosynthesis
VISHPTFNVVRNDGGAFGQRAATEKPPVFGFAIIGGSVNGASVRDIRLANELADRGYGVHVWWVLDRPQAAVLRPSIEEHWLYHGLRHMGGHASNVRDRLGRAIGHFASDKRRSHFIQKRPHVIARMWEGQVRTVCAGVERDKALVRRFGAELAEAEVTHLLPALEVFCPWAAAARDLAGGRFRFAMTFQGYEVYSRYARAIGLEKQFYNRIAEMVAAADWPAIAVSDDYAERIVEDIGVARKSLVSIPPGVPLEAPLDADDAWRRLGPHLRQKLGRAPLVTFVGRQDTEKGIDLLLYAANILRRRGIDLEIAICGATAFGKQYSRVCRQIAEELRLNVRWFEYVTDEMRSALFAVSRCVVYPSIHREPFGMAPVEAMSQRAPVIVPDWGGVASVISAGGREGGLHFPAWDSGALAEQIERLIRDDELHGRLSAAGPHVAEYFSTPRMADRVLDHLDLGHLKVQRIRSSSGAGRAAMDRPSLRRAA